MKEDKTMKELKPALREYYWLISNNKITEQKFVDDILHRINLIQSNYTPNSECISKEKVKELVKSFEPGNITPLTEEECKAIRTEKDLIILKLIQLIK